MMWDNVCNLADETWRRFARPKEKSELRRGHACLMQAQPHTYKYHHYNTYAYQLHLPASPIPRIMHLGLLEHADPISQRLRRSLVAAFRRDPLPE